jgi:uncharacterized protein YjbI with pentapeptide repeats
VSNRAIWGISVKHFLGKSVALLKDERVRAGIGVAATAAIAVARATAKSRSERTGTPASAASPKLTFLKNLAGELQQAYSARQYQADPRLSGPAEPTLPLDAFPAPAETATDVLEEDADRIRQGLINTTAAFVRQSVDEWNSLRTQTSALPILSGANLSGANLRGANHSGADLSDADLSDADLSNADLSGADLSGANLRDAGLSNADLSNADLSGANLSGANLQHADISQASLVRAFLSRAWLEGAKANRADFGYATLSKAKLNGADLNEANFVGAVLARAELCGVSLRGAQLPGVCLSDALIASADINEANLRGADFKRANVCGSVFNRADLSGAVLGGANLAGCDFSGANLSGAVLVYANLNQADLTDADLTGCQVYGAALWGLTLSEDTKQQNLVITPGEPDITVDNLEVAQFIYLLLNNERVRHIIDTITSKVVLILGRFTDERKGVLDALREELRRRDYTPVLFDFEKPRSRSTEETISTLAHMARFVIADLTDAKSVLQELRAIVPTNPSVPVQPLILATQGEPGMFDFFRNYPWMLEPYRYPDPKRLLAALTDRVIAPAELALPKT